MAEIIEAHDWRGNPVSIEQSEERGRWYWFETDEFYDNAAPLVSCTTVIGKIFGRGFPSVAAAAAEHAGERGTEVHNAVRLFSGGVPGMELDWDTLDDEVRPRIEKWRKWTRRVLWVPVHVETAFMSRRYQFACTPDQVGRFSGVGDLGVLEIKPPQSKTVGLQTAAQALAVRECLELDYVPDRIVVYLGEDKCRDEVLPKPKTDRDAFLSALNCYRYGSDKGVFQ